MERVRQALTQPLPGLVAQCRMATRPRASSARRVYEAGPREGAVLLALYIHQGELTLALTRRTTTVGSHKGQIALPGGHREPADETLWQTALRESFEEVGLDPTAVQYIGELSPLYVMASHFVVYPFVGHMSERPAFRLQAAEVAELIEMPLQVILDPTSHHEETWLRGTEPMQVPFYSYDGSVIWGATAMILSEFEALLASIPEAVCP